jgi:hypothetical protein
MRILFALSQVVGILGSVNEPIEATMFKFVSCECVYPESESVDLYPVFSNYASKFALYEWYALDEATFLEKARKPAEAAHKSLIEKPVARDLKAYFETLSRRGLSPEQITTHLLKKYYKSLRSKTELIEIAQEEEE